jgi:hypothetical protein
VKSNILLYSLAMRLTAIVLFVLIGAARPVQAQLDQIMKGLGAGNRFVCDGHESSGGESSAGCAQYFSECDYGDVV